MVIKPGYHPAQDDQRAAFEYLAVLVDGFGQTEDLKRFQVLIVHHLPTPYDDLAGDYLAGNRFDLRPGLFTRQICLLRAIQAGWDHQG